MKDESSLARNNAAFRDLVGFAKSMQWYLRFDLS